MIYLEVLTTAVAVLSALAVILLACIAWQARNQPAKLQQNQWDQDRQTLKQDVMRRIVGSGHRLPRGYIDSDEPFIALNEASVVFSDSPEVIEALSKLKNRGLGEPLAPLLYSVVVAMARSVNITDDVEMDFIGYPFVPGKSSDHNNYPTYPNLLATGPAKSRVLTKERALHILKLGSDHVIKRPSGRRPEASYAGQERCPARCAALSPVGDP